MSTKITVQCDETFEEAFLLGARAYYKEGDEEVYYPSLDFRAVSLPDGLHFPRPLILKNEQALPSIEEAKARAREVISAMICQAVANMILADFAQEP